ncbi:MAG: sialate O-acetylesterase [bacterium]|nr:sialate O-acetylesterase [bacterium]
MPRFDLLRFARLILALSLYPALMAQDSRLVTLLDRAEMRISRVTPGSVVTMALGLKVGRTQLPGGDELGLVPISTSGIAVADADGNALCRVRYPSGSTAGLRYFAQAIVHDPERQVGEPGSLHPLELHVDRVPPRGAPADLLVFFGQSNCEGHGQVTELPPRFRGPQPQVRIWTGAGEWQPLEAGKNTHLAPNSGRFGPEVGFATQSSDGDAPVWLVKVGVGQTSLGPNPGPLNEWGPAAQELYPVLVGQVAAAAAALRQLGYAPRLRLVCMMQGESDAVSLGLAEAYEARLEEMIGRLHADLMQLRLLEEAGEWFCLGNIDARLERQGFQGTHVVRAAQQRVAARHGHGLVTTSGLALRPDGVHFSTPGLLVLGGRFAALW